VDERRRELGVCKKKEMEGAEKPTRVKFEKFLGVHLDPKRKKGKREGKAETSRSPSGI